MADRIKNYQQEDDQITTLKEIRTDLGVTPSSYTPDATVVTKDRVVTFAQAEEELVVLSDIEKGVKQQVTEVDIAQKDIANIKALLQGHLYDYQTDNSSAYTKSVPAGAMPYAGLEKVGGKTLVWNQLSQIPQNATYTETINAHSYYGLAEIPTGSIGHKYYISATFTSIDPTKYVVRFVVNGSYYSGSLPTLFTQNGTVNLRVRLYNLDDTSATITFSNINVRVHDLTLLFGAGNEPSTTAELEALFPSDFYTYNAGTLLSAGVTEVESDSINVSNASINGTYHPHILATYPIPASIQALEGYGWSAGTAYNYIDFERKVFVKNVGAVDLGSLRYSLSPSGLYICTIDSTRDVNNVIPNIICPLYKPVSSNNITGPDGSNPSPDMVFSIGSGKKLYINNLSYYHDIPAFTAAMNNMYIYYELEIPVETDISEYLTDDNLIQVEAGGALTFENQHGDDYRLPVPSAETFMIDLQEAINNG